MHSIPPRATNGARRTEKESHRYRQPRLPGVHGWWCVLGLLPRAEGGRKSETGRVPQVGKRGSATSIPCCRRPAGRSSAGRGQSMPVCFRSLPHAFASVPFTCALFWFWLFWCVCRARALGTVCTVSPPCDRHRVAAISVLSLPSSSSSPPLFAGLPVQLVS